MTWLRRRLLALLWPTGRDAYSGYGACANRYTRTTMVGPWELTIIHRDTREPDGYSREELVVMLETIRKHEAIMGWRVPDPATSAAHDVRVSVDDVTARLYVNGYGVASWPSAAQIRGTTGAEYAHECARVLQEALAKGGRR